MLTPARIQIMTTLRAALILFASFRVAVCIPLRDFYSFGFAQLDSALPRNDDRSSPAINLSVTFPYFDRNYRVVYVNNNGAISFTRAISQFTPDPFPLNSTQDIIAAYWGDVDTRPADGGTVWYRETSNSLLLSRFRDEIRAAFPNQREFIPTSLFIVTWDHVGYYGGNTDKNNTFQCVLGTDERRAYVILLYADGKIQWTTGDSSGGENGFGGTPALAGFNAGDSIRFFNVPGSRTPDIINITTTSNVNKPGVWIFRIDDERIVTAGCSMEASNEALLLAPRLGNVLGGTPVQLSGPCFEETDDITCYFDDIAITGTRLDRNRVLCVSPELNIIGRIALKLTVVRADEAVFNGQVTFHSIAFDDAKEVNIVDSAPVLRCAVPLFLEWLPGLFFPKNAENSTSGLVNIELYQYRKAAQSSKWQKMIGLATNIPNFGKATIEIPKSILVQDPQMVVIKISLSPDQSLDITDQLRIAEWSGLAFTESMDATLSKLCFVWSNGQKINVGEVLLERLPPCPPNVQLALLDSLYLEDSQTSSYREFFHPNASRCFHQATFTSDNQGSGQQCCYFSDGTLIVGVPNGGNADMVASQPDKLDTIIDHQFEDVLPYIYCCKESVGKCNEYYSNRPSDNGRNYEVTPPACVYGDPHIVTLDGYKYTFNGKGEFTLIETPGDRFTLQARMIEAMGTGGDTVQATVFSALVGKQNDSDTVQLELSRRGIDAKVNGMRVDFEDVVQQSFNNVTLFDVGNRTIEAIFSSGVLLSAKEENGIISVLLVSLSNSYMGSTRGLMGIFNDDTSDDLIPKESSEPIPLNSSLETIHNSFGITWIINNSADSLFDYHEPGESWSTYYDPDFTPLFGAEFSDPEEEAEAMELCQGDEFCLYDFATTGSMDISLSTLNGSVNYEEMVETARPIICNPSCVNGACIANDTCQCALGYTGQICTEPVYIECDVNPCENNGTCQSLAGSYICNCSRGFSGLFCEQNVTFRFEKDHYTVNEEGGRVELCILQSGESIIDLSITAAPQEFTAEGGVDYVSSPVSVQFNQTDDRKCFHITIIDDFNRESTETFEVALLLSTGVTLVDPSLATVAIIDDDTNRTYDFVEETLYTVPLHIDEELVETHPELSRATLCYSIDGRANRYFNLVSDKCVSVNAYYVPAQRANFFNVISKIGVTAVDSDGNIQNIEIDQENCSATVGTTPVTSEAIYHSANITVRRRRNGYRIAVPNCEPRHLVIWVTCESTRDADLLKFVIARGVNLMPTSHGLVGQFWNVPADISPYEGPTPDDSSYYLVMVSPPNGKPRQFVGDLYPQAWDLSPVPCIYAGNSQGGTLGEFGDANDPVIEGHYSEYVVADLFATQFKYSQFNN